MIAIHQQNERHLPLLIAGPRRPHRHRKPMTAFCELVKFNTPVQYLAKKPIRECSVEA